MTRLWIICTRFNICSCSDRHLWLKSLNCVDNLMFYNWGRNNEFEPLRIGWRQVGISSPFQKTVCESWGGGSSVILSETFIQWSFRHCFALYLFGKNRRGRYRFKIRNCLKNVKKVYALSSCAKGRLISQIPFKGSFLYWAKATLLLDGFIKNPNWAATKITEIIAFALAFSQCKWTLTSHDMIGRTTCCCCFFFLRLCLGVTYHSLCWQATLTVWQYNRHIVYYYSAHVSRTSVVCCVTHRSLRQI